VSTITIRNLGVKILKVCSVLKLILEVGITQGFPIPCHFNDLDLSDGLEMQIKMDNYRTKLSRSGCEEVAVNCEEVAVKSCGREAKIIHRVSTPTSKELVQLR